MPVEDLRKIALRVIEGIGDEALGQWEERGERAFHIRRRLSDAERRRAGGLEELDIRDTAEYGVRRAAIQRYLPPEYANWHE